MNIRSSAATPISGIRRLRGYTTALVAATVTISACGSSGSSSSSSSSTAKTNLNTPHVERAIEQSILRERHVHAKVICPKVVPQEKGHNFTCIAKVGKNTTPFTVVQQNNSGYVTYQAK